MTTLAEAVAGYAARATRTATGCLVGPTKHYGTVKFDHGRQMGAHRAAYIVAHGPIPEGLVVRHSCDNPPCVEPSHLLLGTQRDNEHDKIARGRQPRGLAAANATVSPEAIAAAVQRYLAGGVSQEEMARQLGVSATTFGRWVRGEARSDSGVVGVTVGNGSRIATGLKGCGTRAAAHRHRRAGEPVCGPCQAADRAYMEAYKAKRGVAS